MAINLASKYSDKIAEGFRLKSVVDGTVCKDYDFEGVKNLKIYTPVTQSLNDYKRSGTNRYGDPTELQDSLQDMTMMKDRSFSITIDKGNNSEQMDTKTASRMLALEMDEKVIPEMDKYALGKYIDFAGMRNALSAEPTEDTIAKAISDGMVHMSNKKVPVQNRTIFIGWNWFGMLRLSKQFIGVDDLAKNILTNGTLGLFMGARVVPVPDEYLQKGGNQCYFLIVHKNSAIQPKKIQDYFAKQNPPGINGSLLEGRFIYDAFVLSARCDGVYAAVAPSTVQANPTFSASGSTLTVTSAGATKIRVTLDGTDPLYSDSAIETTSGGTVTLPSGKTKARAVALDDVLFTSAVVEDSERTVA